MRSVLTSLFFTLLLFTSVLLSQTPSTLSIQGVLRDATGAAVADGSYSMTFNLYTATTGGSALWTETQSTVAVQNGVFSVQLGSVSPLSSVAFNQQYYIGVTTGGVEMSPRITLTAAPYAMGFKGTSNVFGSSGNVGIGTLNPSELLHVAGNIKAGYIRVNDATVDANATISGTATIGVANVGTLNAGPTTTAALTVNGNASITEAITSTNIVNSGAISTGGATLVGASVSAMGDLISQGGRIKSGSQTAVVANVGLKIYSGLISSTGSVSNGTGDFTASRISTGIYKITFQTGVGIVYGITATPYMSTGNGSSDYRWFFNINNVTSSSFQVSVQNTGGALSDINFYFIAITTRDSFGI